MKSSAFVEALAHTVAMKETRKYWFFAVVLVALVIGAAWIFSSPRADTRGAVRTDIVTFTDKGFFPQKILIKIGDTVTFKSESGDFWPASDPHPVHNIYDTFDPGHAIKETDVWTLTFDRAGVWKYHDHLAANFKGEVLVTDANGSLPIANCKALSGADIRVKQQCWIEEVDALLQKSGVGAAFKKVQELAQAEPDFSQVCHDTMHRVGAAAYHAYVAQKRLDFTADTALCGFGFYHGFTETFAQEGGTPRDAIAFCAQVGTDLGEKYPDITLQCHHGIGHGSVIVDDPALWGNEEAMIARAKKLCIVTSENSEQLQRCGSGIFDSISIAYFTHTQNLAIRSSDPFWLCKAQAESEFKSACYTSISVALMWSLDLDIQKAAAIVAQIPERDLAINTMNNLAVSLVNVRSQRSASETEEIATLYAKTGPAMCSSLAPQFQIPCMKSIATALTTSDGTDENYRRGITFCNESVKGGAQKDACWSTAKAAFSISYTPERRSAICSSLREEERTRLCTL